MKISKSWFKTSVEFTPDELKDLQGVEIETRESILTEILNFIKHLIN